MPVAKIYTGGTPNAMKSEEGNDSLDTFISQAIGKEPLPPLSRTGDSPVQWIQLLHALDQPDLPGWPLLTPIKVQMQKCEKCSREFLSPINYRRHIRVHRRSLNVNKESHKDRDLLAAFWNKLSLEEAKEVVSFNGVTLKEIPGSSVVRALASSLRKPGVWTLPQVYVKAGSALLDIIQARPSRLPISSQELFSILDDASERTFLCAGTAESLQKYVFDGETAKNSLELKNLVAGTSFLFEQQLVKAWMADKDAEALRCEKLLVEEEEAVQRRQAALLERKRQKKLRQKEQKVKGKLYGCNGDLNVAVDEVERPASAEESGPSSPSDSNSDSLAVPLNVEVGLESMQYQSKDLERDTETHFNSRGGNINPGATHTPELQIVASNGYRHSANTRWHFRKSQRGVRYGFHVSQHHQPFKTEPIHKLGPPKVRGLTNGIKVWTKKLKSDDDGEKQPLSSQVENSHVIEANNCEVMIGSISVTLKCSAAQQPASQPDEAQDGCSTEHASLKNEDSVKVITNQMASKYWRPVEYDESKSNPAVDRGKEDSKGGSMFEKVHWRILFSERSTESQATYEEGCDKPEDMHVLPNENANPGSLPFSSVAAREFLARRWKEAISSEHVKLVLSPGPEKLDDVGHDCSTTVSDASSHVEDRSAEKNQGGRSAHAKFRKKQEKSMKTKYIPKQKAAA